MRAIVTGGGTGGHIYPALAIINKIKEKDKNSEILYIGTNDRMEKDVVPKQGIEFIGLEMSGLNRKNVFSNFSVIKKYMKAVSSAKEIIKDFKPDIVIGVGGYITAPVLYAAHKLKIKTVIHEQNSIPGVSNKFLGKIADKIFVSLPGSIKYFNKNKTVYTGNPRSEQIKEAKVYKKENLGFSENKKLVVIVMGSLGSITMTAKLKELIPKFNDKNYQVLIITGKNYYDDYQDLKVNKNIKIVPFLDNLINLLKDTDLIVSRAGASTIAEVTSIGLPAILVPSPYVTHNHQYQNALELENIGACKIIEEKDFSFDKIIPEIDKILDDDKLYKKIHEQSKSLCKDTSATMIYTEIERLIGK